MSKLHVEHDGITLSAVNLHSTQQQDTVPATAEDMMGLCFGYDADDDDGCAGSWKMYLPAFWRHCVPQCKASILVDGVNADVFLSSYLHSCSPPIIHGNLTCDTIFIQHNGLVKIGSVAPDAIHHHVKTCRDNMKNMHFIAPEYAGITYKLT
uniref:Protein kinase domain-containing protein n=1 Tax=Timema monikensis TaxID=170555 RepID=A0A7R9HPR3_9NEOP|nr:unnamed protein product [Timema monikensis]